MGPPRCRQTLERLLEQTVREVVVAVAATVAAAKEVTTAAVAEKKAEVTAKEFVAMVAAEKATVAAAKEAATAKEVVAVMLDPKAGAKHAVSSMGASSPPPSGFTAPGASGALGMFCLSNTFFSLSTCTCLTGAPVLQRVEPGWDASS
jgi:hypothetical protein